VEFADGAVQNSQDLLQAKGFHVAGFAMRVADKKRFKVIALGAQVHLEDDLGENLYVRCGALLGGNFRPLKAAQQILYLHDWITTAEPSKSLDWQLEVVAAQTKIAMHELHEETLPQLRDLDIAVAPSQKRGVWTKRDFAPRELKLVPLTPNVVMRAMSDKAPGIDIGITLRDPRNNREKKVCSGILASCCKRMSELLSAQASRTTFSCNTWPVNFGTDLRNPVGVPRKEGCTALHHQRGRAFERR
jgi:hypothetical protein